MMEKKCRVLLVLLLFNYIQISRSSQICTAVDKIGNTQSGVMLKERLFLNETNTSYMFCARLCGRHKLCRSFNWNKNQDVCELNYDDDGPFITNSQYIFTNITGWPNVINDACSNHDCPVNTRCDVTSSEGFTCVVIGCWGVPLVSNVNTTSFSVMSLWNFNDMVLYPCDQGFYPSVNVTCTANGTWLNFTCFEIAICDQALACSGNVEGGEYWIRSQSFSNMIRVYCDLNSRKEYITLIEYNTALKSPLTRNNDSCDLHDITPHRDYTGQTDFQKVRIILNQKRLAINIPLFSNTSLKFQNYGNAGDCVNYGINCSVAGKFIVDLGGTSFRVNQSTSWQGKEQNPRIESIIFSNDDTRVVGRCGGNCGGCRPTYNKIYVESNPHFQPPNTSAEHVLCPFSVV